VFYKITARLQIDFKRSIFATADENRFNPPWLAVSFEKCAESCKMRKNEKVFAKVIAILCGMWYNPWALLEKSKKYKYGTFRIKNERGI